MPWEIIPITPETYANGNGVQRLALMMRDVMNNLTDQKHPKQIVPLITVVSDTDDQSMCHGTIFFET